MDKHPLRIAFEQLDPDLLEDALAEDVIFYTPILTSPLSGREVTKRILLTSVAGFGPPELTGEFTSDDGRRILTWDCTMDGHPMQAALTIVDGPDGKVTELRGAFRPWPVVTLFRDYMYSQVGDEVPVPYWELKKDPT
jgi:hypothetical protein